MCQQISEVAMHAQHSCKSGHDTKLDSQTRRLMERCFSEDFRRVDLSLLPDSSCPSRFKACTIGQRIFIARRYYQPDTALGRHILAHELAHVVQKRRGRDRSRDASIAAGPAFLVEMEANMAAAVVGSGAEFACSLADRADCPRCYGPAGHYYTVYFLLVGAGLSNDSAAQIAFWAQMPDQIAELDGFLAAIRLQTTICKAPPPSRNRSPSTQSPPEPVECHPQDMAVLIGLHTLTGGPSAPATARFRQILLDAKLDSLKFGLAIHAYGDSFAHRVLDHPDRLYGPQLGHTVEWVETMTVRGTEDCDHINRRPDLYNDYCLALYDIICKKTPQIKDRLFMPDEATRLARYGANVTPAQAEQNQIVEQLTNVVEKDTEEGQISALRRLIANLGVRMDDYEPEKEAKAPWKTAPAWEKFRAAHPERVASSNKEEALACARVWMQAS
jgi:hypothetical protein